MGNAPNWLIAVVVTAIVTVAARAILGTGLAHVRDAAAARLSKMTRRIWRVLVTIQRLTIADGPTRRRTLGRLVARSRRCPAWLVRRVVVDGCRRRPANYGPSTFAVARSHRDEAVRQQAEALLWRTVRTNEMRPGDVIRRWGHRGFGHPSAPAAHVHAVETTEDGESVTVRAWPHVDGVTFPAGEEFILCAGWCPAHDCRRCTHAR